MCKRVGLVFGRDFFGIVDDEDVHRLLSRVQSETEFILKGREDGGCIGEFVMGCAVGSTAGASGTTGSSRTTGLPDRGRGRASCPRAFHRRSTVCLL